MDRICLFFIRGRQYLFYLREIGKKYYFAGPLSLGAVDQLVDDGHGGKTVNDDYRIAYLRDHIREMGEAIRTVWNSGKI